MQQQTPPEQFDMAGIVADLNSLLRLKTTVIGMKMFATVEEMEAIPKIRPERFTPPTRSSAGLAAGMDGRHHDEDLVGAQCRAVIGLPPQDEKWLAGKPMPVYGLERRGLPQSSACAGHRAARPIPGDGGIPLARPPQSSGHLPRLWHPGQMIIFINGLQWAGYKKFQWGVVGESACADSWGRALKTGEPSLSNRAMRSGATAASSMRRC